MTEPKIHTHDRAFDFLRINERPAKPRSCGVTEIRGPYYTPLFIASLGCLLCNQG